MEDHEDVRIISAPYDTGHPGLRMGAGPGHLLSNGLVEALRSGGRSPGVTSVRHVGEPPAEVSTAFELHGLVAEQVRLALANGEFPMVLAGNCNTAAIGALAGAGREDIGVVWFDAHGEFNTPETTTSGFLDGMGLAIAVGGCWREMARGVSGFSPVREENVIMVGVRDVDRPERERLDASGVTVVGATTLSGALDDLRSRVETVYVHLDLDVLDARKVGAANEFAPEGGPDAEELEAALGMVCGRFEVAACGIASYDPSFDAQGRVLRAALACAGILVGGPTWRV